MEIRVKDIIGVGIASLLLFPVVFFSVLLATGTAHVEIGGVDEQTRKKFAGYLERHTPAQELQDLEQSKLFEANKKLQAELIEQETRLREEAARLELIKLENAKAQEKINQERSRIDQLVEKSQDLSDQKVEELAQVYGAMKPVEAAPILMNLDNVSIAKIIKRVPEPRAQAKLLAAIGALSTQRAANITKILGWKKQGI